MTGGWYDAKKLMECDRIMIIIIGGDDDDRLDP